MKKKMNMKILRYCLLLISVGLVSSCTNKKQAQKEEFDLLFAEVMKVHDDVMPETNNLYKIRKFAQENIDVLPDTSQYIEQLKDLQINAQKADDVMMNWMEKFAVPNSTHQEKISYLEEEKKSIKKVRDIMLNTLFEGKKVIRASDKFIKENKLRDERKTNLRPI